MWCPASDSWYSTGSPPASSRPRARRANSTSMIGSWRPWAMNARVSRAQVRLPALDGGDEAREGEDPGGRRAVGTEPERVAHHRAHREAAEHGALGRDAGALPQRVVERAELAVRGVERVGVRVADARHDVPVVARPAGELERRARRDDVQAPLGVRARRRDRAGRARRRRGRGAGRAARRPPRPPGARDTPAHSWDNSKLARPAHAVTRRGFSTGRRICSRRGRRCSCMAGRRSSSPRCSGSSSTAKPGPIVAISNRTPRGSRK